MSVALHVNVDHVATLRQARGTRYPDPVHAALLCERAGAAGITVHLREDRRHIQDRDVRVLRETVSQRLNLEMAATEEMLAIALEVGPDLVTLVPEKREEQTTEGGLDVAGQESELKTYIGKLTAAGIPVSLFIDPDTAQIAASAAVGAHAIELHTGDYAEARGADVPKELARLAEAAAYSADTFPALEIAAGHGLTSQNLPALLAEVPEIIEVNIGHALVADAVFDGMERAVERYLDAILSAPE